MFDLISKIYPLRISADYFIPYKAVLTNPTFIQKVSNDPMISDARKFAVSTYKDMLSWDVTKIAGKIDVPVLVLTQKTEGVLQSPNQSILLYNALKEPKKLKQINTGHVPDLENPLLVSQIILEWFEITME